MTRLVNDRTELKFSQRFNSNGVRNKQNHQTTIEQMLQSKSFLFLTIFHHFSNAIILYLNITQNPSFYTLLFSFLFSFLSDINPDCTQFIICELYFLFPFSLDVVVFNFFCHSSKPWFSFYVMERKCDRFFCFVFVFHVCSQVISIR